jgi:hypothetical protein
MDDNPVYRDLMQHTAASSERLAAMTRWVGYISTVMTLSGLALLALGVWQAALALLPLALAALVYLIFLPSLALIATIQLTQRHASPENLALVRLTQVTPAQILEAYGRAAAERLRVLRGLGRAVLPLVVVIPAWGGYAFLASLGGSGHPLIVLAFMLLSLLLATPVLGIAFSYGMMLYDLAVPLGLWVGFRWKQHALAIAGAVIIAALVAILLFGAFAVSITFTESIFPPQVCSVGVVLWVLLILTYWLLPRLARRAALRAVQRE